MRFVAATAKSTRAEGRLAVVGSLFGVSVVLFPHYQAIARERLGLTFENMMVWVVVQNAGTALFSFIVGPLADRRGNRYSFPWALPIPPNQGPHREQPGGSHRWPR